MATKQCWRCGGQMSSYSSTCQWCGRSTWTTAFLQLCSFAAVMGGLLWFTGMIRKQGIVELFDAGGAIQTAVATPTSPPPAPAARVRTAAGTAGKAARAPRTRQPAETRDRKAAAADAAAPGAEACSSPARVERLRRQHGDWSARELELISCGEVQPGFSEAQLRAALGEPTSVDPAADEEAGTATWRYGAVRVLVAGGRVVGISR